jgi:hypothetical protein
MNDTTRAAPSGPVLWFATFGSIATWMTHLIAEAALVPLREAHPTTVWVMHGLTIALALVVLVGMRISWSYAHIGSSPESMPTPVGRTVFLGWLGLFVGGLNLLLIVYEGLIIVLVHTGRT